MSIVLSALKSFEANAKPKLCFCLEITPDINSLNSLKSYVTVLLRTPIVFEYALGGGGGEARCTAVGVK